MLGVHSQRGKPGAEAYQTHHLTASVNDAWPAAAVDWCSLRVRRHHVGFSTILSDVLSLSAVYLTLGYRPFAPPK